MSVSRSEADRERAQYAALTRHYGAIGPADLLAVLVAMRRAAAMPKPQESEKKKAG